MNKKLDFSLILAFLIPVLMILFVAASIYLPGLFIKPQYGFLYYYEDSYYGVRYEVRNSELIKIQPTAEQMKYNNSVIEPRLFIYDVAKNEGKEVSFEYAKLLGLDSNLTSPDGFNIDYGSRGDGFFPFFFYSGSDYSTRYLKGHNVSKKINLQNNGSYYNFRLLGWIK